MLALADGVHLEADIFKHSVNGSEHGLCRGASLLNPEMGLDAKPYSTTSELVVSIISASCTILPDPP